MKRLCLILKLNFLIILFFGQLNFAQNSFYSLLKNIDLSEIINPKFIYNDENQKIERPEILGFIGNDYQRFQIHFLTFEKSKKNPYEYHVTGKTRVKQKICDFTGNILIKSANYENSGMLEDIGFSNYKEGTITSMLTIFENKNQKNSGKIIGTLKTNVYVDLNKNVQYNALWLVSDGFENNQFIGTWTSFKSGISKKCNWGDFRIPESGDLDLGAGEFSINEKYQKNGWNSYVKAYCCGNENDRKKALNRENKKWWK